MAHLIDHPDWQLALAARMGPGVKGLPGHRLKMLPMDMVSYQSNGSQPPTIDTGKMAVTACISTPGLDQSRDVVMGEGIDTSIHQKNPLVLFMHKPTLPIAKSFSPATGYAVTNSGDATLATAFFFQNSADSVSFGASLSPSKHVTASMSLGMPRYCSLVRNSKLHAIASFLK